MLYTESQLFNWAQPASPLLLRSPLLPPLLHPMGLKYVSSLRRAPPLLALPGHGQQWAALSRQIQGCEESGREPSVNCGLDSVPGVGWHRGIAQLMWAAIMSEGPRQKIGSGLPGAIRQPSAEPISVLPLSTTRPSGLGRGRGEEGSKGHTSARGAGFSNTKAPAVPGHCGSLVITLTAKHFSRRKTRYPT